MDEPAADVGTVSRRIGALAWDGIELNSHEVSLLDDGFASRVQSRCDERLVKARAQRRSQIKLAYN